MADAHDPEKPSDSPNVEDVHRRNYSFVLSIIRCSFLLEANAQNLPQKRRTLIMRNTNRGEWRQNANER